MTQGDIDAYTRRLIRREIQTQLMIILSGVSGADDPTQFTQDISQLYPGADTILKRPLMHPYGFVSRAPAGKLQVVGRQGDHPSNRLILGYRDDARPSDFDEGGSMLYSSEDIRLYVGTDGIYVGVGSQDKPLVLGTELNDFLGQLIDLLVAHVHPSPGAPSDKSADFLQLKTEVIDGMLLVSTIDGGLA